jgi:hypothetical protein
MRAFDEHLVIGEEDKVALNDDFQFEQNYRHDCEDIDRTNSYGERGSEKSTALGLTQLKRTADAEHSDVQSFCGQCLSLGYIRLCGRC